MRQSGSRTFTDGLEDLKLDLTEGLEDFGHFLAGGFLGLIKWSMYAFAAATCRYG
jgi:hypothetical protein